MSVKIITSLILILLLISFFSGCTIFQNTELELVSLNVVDDEGFVAVKIEFNISGTATLSVLKPNGLVIFSEEYLRGLHTVYAYLDDFKQTPMQGTYKIKAEDGSGNKIYEENLVFSEKNITVQDIYEYWWKDDDRYSLVGLKINMKNNGDLPVYAYKAIVNIAGKSSSSYLFPNVIMPFESKEVFCCTDIEDIAVGNNEITISVNDIEDKNLVHKSYTIFPDENVNDISFNWRYIGARELVIPDLGFLYDYHSELDRLDTSDYAAYEFDPYDNYFTDMLANRLQSVYDSNKDTSTINFIATFVQNIQYVEDSTECDYPRYPIEALKDREGDCEDKAILTATILHAIGYNVSLIQLPKHVAVGVHLEAEAVSDDYFIDEYYFLETSSTGWFVGKIPPEHKGKTNITVYTLESRPVLVHSWKNATRFTDSEGSDYIKMKIITENLGSKSSGPFEIKTSFFSLNDNIINQEITNVPSISEGNKRIVELTIDVPQGVSTKLKSQIFLDNEKVHQRESVSTFP